jgi:small subunit ribosomal protein S1
MEAELRPVSVDDREWWTSLDESYWQALLVQGEVAPEVSPLTNPQEPLTILDLEPGVEVSGDGSGAREREESLADDGWQAAQQALDGGDSFHLQISGANRGGVLVDWNGLQGFVPASHLIDMPRSQEPQGRVAELSRRIGDAVTVRLIEVDPEQKRLVFSERAAMSGPDSPEAVLNSLHPGDVCQGTVTNLTTFGAFVDLGGIEGLIHISELSWDRVRHPSDVLHPGQDVSVHVLGVNPEEKRIALSLKRLRPDPWHDVASRYQVGEIIEGTVTNVVNFGAFVRVEEGLEGLIHISELAEGSFLHPRNVVREGDRVRVRVLKIDAPKHRLALSLRQAFGSELDW